MNGIDKETEWEMFGEELKLEVSSPPPSSGLTFLSVALEVENVQVDYDKDLFGSNLSPPPPSNGLTFPSSGYSSKEDEVSNADLEAELEAALENDFESDDDSDFDAKINAAFDDREKEDPRPTLFSQVDNSEIIILDDDDDESSTPVANKTGTLSQSVRDSLRWSPSKASTGARPVERLPSTPKAVAPKKRAPRAPRVNKPKNVAQLPKDKSKKAGQLPPVLTPANSASPSSVLPKTQATAYSNSPPPRSHFPTSLRTRKSKQS